MGIARRLYENSHVERIGGWVGIFVVLAGVFGYLRDRPDWDVIAWTGAGIVAVGGVAIVLSIFVGSLPNTASNALSIVGVLVVVVGVAAILWFPRADPTDDSVVSGDGTDESADGTTDTTTEDGEEPNGSTTTATAATTRRGGGPGPTQGPGPTTPTTVTTTPPTTRRPSTTAAPPTSPPPPTLSEQQGSLGADSFLNPENASGVGPRVEPYQWVAVSCRVYAPQVQSANPDGWWYRIASSPWNDNYHVAANTFWNGDVPGQPPYENNTDFNVPIC